MTTPQQSAEFRDLCEALIEQRATPQQIARLEELFFSSAELRQQYIELAHLNASLAAIGRHAGWQTIIEQQLPEPPTIDVSSRSYMAAVWGAALVTGLALSLFVLTSFLYENSSEQNFVTLSYAAGTKWESSTVPTFDNARIGAGRIRLAEGIAKLIFDNGATVELEGPADFKIETPLRCHLYHGKLVATMSTTSQGFAVETPEALLVDQGTSFGVSVASNGLSTLQVFDGLVEVTHHPTGQEMAVEESQAVEISASSLTKLANLNETTLGLASPRADQRRQSQITTAMGAGEDHYILRNENFRDGPQDLLMVKLSAENFSGYDRKIYLKFDLREVDLSALAEATLTLTASPTDLGYASRMPDAHFDVYALTDDQLDHWQASSLTWENAPANVSAGDQLDPASTRLLGSFEIPRGQKHGLFSVASPSLVDVIRSDTNQLLTLIVVPRTREVQSGALVHGFASGNHATLPAPTLRLVHQE